MGGLGPSSFECRRDHASEHPPPVGRAEEFLSRADCTRSFEFNQQILNMLSRSKIPGMMSLVVLMLGLTSRVYAATQNFSLSPQWNLISFQLVPDNPQPAAVFATLPGF